MIRVLSLFFLFQKSFFGFLITLFVFVFEDEEGIGGVAPIHPL